MKKKQQYNDRPSYYRLVRTLVVLCGLVLLASWLRRADVFFHTTTAKHRRNNKRRRNAPDPNVLIAEQQQRQQNNSNGGLRMSGQQQLQPLKNDNNDVEEEEEAEEESTASVTASQGDGDRGSNNPSSTSSSSRRIRVALDLANLKDNGGGGDRTTGTLVIELREEWAPIGVAHFQKLMAANFYDNVRFFRVLPNFVAQFGISSNPATQQIWEQDVLKEDDPVRHPNERGTLTYATSGPHTRTTQLFINLADNRGLDQQGFAPFATVVSGWPLLDLIQDKYRERPDQGQIQLRGNEYLAENFPDLTYIAKARIVNQA